MCSGGPVKHTLVLGCGVTLEWMDKYVVHGIQQRFCSKNIFKYVLESPLFWHVLIFILENANYAPCFLRLKQQMQHFES
jgi:hypothetical protein